MPRLAVLLGPALLALGVVAAPVPALGAPTAAAPAAPTSTAPAREPLAGKVLEATTAGGYTYLRLATTSGEVWAAVQAADVRPGTQVRIERPMTMERFESKSLKRTFDKIVFGQLAGVPAAPGAAPPMAMGMPGATPRPAPPASHGATPAVAATPVAKVAKAEGLEGRTVAEVVTGKARLKDKTVAVRGQVVKVSAGILGKNWVHLQDGSGSAGDGSHDLVVTMQDKPAVGDIVHLRGTVRTDVELGAGYRYAVLLEGATLRKP